MLSALAETKQKEIKREVEEQIQKAKKDAEQGNPSQIPPGLYMLQDSGIHVITEQSPSNGIKSAISNLLHEPEKKWQDALTSIVNTALDTLIGNAFGTSSNKSLYLITLDGHAADPSKGIEETYVPVRIDYCIWTYNFSSKGIKDAANSAVAYYAQSSLLDYSNIPSNLQIDQSLKLIGIQKTYREEIIKQIEEERDGKRPKNIASYALGVSPELQKTISSQFQF